jgi:hypothetical protein
MNPHIHSCNKYPEYSFYDRSVIRDLPIEGKICILFNQKFEQAPYYYFHFKSEKFFFYHNHPEKIKHCRNRKAVEICDKKLRELYEHLKSERNIFENKIAHAESQTLRQKLNLICKAITHVECSLKSHEKCLK